MALRRKGSAFAASLLALAALADCSDVDAADQKVIDHLATLDVLGAPPGATRLSYTE